jgi:uncharacterized protein (DUF433 family)
MNFNYADYFERRTELCGGALVVKGTRVPVRTLLASLAEGATEAEVLKDFPTVTPDGLRAVIAFAASVGDDLPVSPAPDLDALFGSVKINRPAASIREEKRAARAAMARAATSHEPVA